MLNNNTNSLSTPRRHLIGRRVLSKISLSQQSNQTTEKMTEKIYVNGLLTEKLKKLYLNETTADVYFLFVDKLKSERVPAHKNLLLAGSDAFEGMLYGDLKEEGDIKITDVSVAGFKEFLKFFYFEKIDLTIEHIYDVVYLANKYLFTDCLNICKKFLKDCLSDDNVCSIYDLASNFNFVELQKSCESHIIQHAETVLRGENFVECTESVLSRILNFELLSCPETTVFDACIAWLKAASKQDEVTRESLDKHLGKLFHKIRFGSMTIQEFATISRSYGKLFTPDEYHEIVQTIALSDFEPKIFRREARGISSASVATSVPKFEPAKPKFEFKSEQSSSLPVNPFNILPRSRIE